MSSIESRITTLADAIQRRQLEQSAPADELSKSLFDLQKELATLDDVGRAKLVEELNTPSNGESGSLNLTIQDIEHFVADYGRKG